MLSKLFKGVFILVSALLLALFFLWQRLVIVGIETGLQGSGYQLDEIRIGKIGLSQAYFPLIRLRGAAGEILAQGVFEEVTLQYDLQALRDGRLAMLSVQHARLTFQESPATDNSPTPISPLFGYLALTPDITTISRLSWWAAPGLVDGQVALQVRKSTSGLRGNLVDLNDASTQAQFKVQSGPVNGLDLSLIQNGEAVLRLTGQISPDNQQGLRVNGNFYLKTTAMQTLAARYRAQTYPGIRDISGDLTINWSGTVDNDLGTLLQSANLDWDARSTFSGSLVAERPLKFQTNLHLVGKFNKDRLELVAQPGGELAVDIPLDNQPVADISAQIRLEQPFHMVVKSLFSEREMGVEISGQLAVSLLVDKQPANLVLGLKQLICKPVVDLKCQIKLALEADVRQLQYADYRLTGFGLALEGTLDLDNEGLRFSMDSGMQGRLKNLYFPEGELQDIQWQSGAVGLTSGLDGNDLKISLASIDLSAIAAHYQEYRLTPAVKFTKLSAHFGDKLQVKANFAGGPWDIKHPQDWLPPLPKMNGKLAFNGERLDINAQLVGTLPQVQAQFNLQHGLKTNESRLQFKLNPVDWLGEDNKLAGLFPGWPYPVGIASGQIQAEADLTVKWPAQGAPQMTGELNATLKNVTGFVEDIYFSGLSTHFAPQRHTGDSGIEFSGKLQLETVDVGLPLSNLVLDYRAAVAADLQRGTLSVEGLSTHLLSGTLTMAPANFNWPDTSGRMDMKLNNLSLQQLVALGEYPGLEISGVIGGQLPVSIGPRGARVEQGWLEAKPPGGVIRYRQEVPLSLNSTNAQLQLVRDVLKNFKYDSLKTQVNYSEQGDLLLAVQIQGANPDVARGREIHLNLNLEENIAALLRSLKMSREFSDFVQGRFSQKR